MKKTKTEERALLAEREKARQLSAELGTRGSRRKAKSRLRDVVVSAVAIVDRPANQRSFLMMKAEDWDSLVASLQRAPMSPTVKQRLFDALADTLEKLVAVTNAVSEAKEISPAMLGAVEAIGTDLRRTLKGVSEAADSREPRAAEEPVTKALQASLGGDLALELVGHLATKSEGLERERDAAIRARDEATATAQRIAKALEELGRVVAQTGDAKAQLIVGHVFNKHFPRPVGRA